MQTARSLLAGFGAFAALFVATAARADLPTYTAERIALPPAFRPADFNAAGDIVGYKLLSSTGQEGTERLAFRQTGGSPPQLFSDLPSGDRHAALFAVNDAGLAVGFGSVMGDPRHRYGGVYDPEPHVNGARAQLVTPQGHARDLSESLPAGADSLAVDVNASGQVVGSFFVWSEAYRGMVARPFVWSERDGMQFPFDTHPNDPPITASRINEAGHIAGSILNAYDVGNGGFVWDPVGGKRWIRGRISRVHAINNHDQVVGVDAFYKAFVWTEAGGKKILPMLTNRRSEHCEALDINDAGVIVGVCRHVPTIWIPQGDDYRVADLRQMIVPPPGGLPVWYDWSEALRIDAAGRILLRGYTASWHDADEPGFSALLTPRP